eukprot:EG_transcript_19845
MPAVSLEAAQLAMGGPRIKYGAVRAGPSPAFLGDERLWRPLSDALHLLEQLGAAPVLPDGKVGGNLAALTPAEAPVDESGIIVSRSGKEAGKMSLANDFTVVKGFNAETWTGTFLSHSEDAKPSSDTPLLWHALKVAPGRFGWPQQPQVALHGHSFETKQEAEQLGLPVSATETLFSTPEDTAALMELFESFHYPEHRIFIRQGHGFFILAPSIAAACEELTLLTSRAKLLAPAVPPQKKPRTPG